MLYIDLRKCEKKRVGANIDWSLYFIGQEEKSMGDQMLWSRAKLIIV